MIKNITMNGDNATISYDNGKSITVNKDYLSKTAKDWIESNKNKKPVTDAEKAACLYRDGKITSTEYNAIAMNKISLGRLNKIKSYMKFYARKAGIYLDGLELLNKSNTEVAYYDYMSYAMNNKGKLAKLCEVTANMIADYQNTVFC